MGGKGSGRSHYSTQYNSKNTTEGSLPLDIRSMQRHGGLKPGAYLTWRWQRGSAPKNGNSIGCLCIGDKIVLIYKHQGENVRQPVQVEYSPCHYGGQRPWWKCPACQRRVAVLYGAGKYFACRHCYNLCYTSQKENQGDRALRQAWKIRQRLGQESGGHVRPLPDKPKGMHWETYSRLVMRCRDYERTSWAALKIWLDKREGKHF